ncbi:MAG: hypothetical protein QME13_08010, partial [Thermoanaerobacteraceae bacterium]|nr:hypothetical protein [Thermoanaerobacteraceae bacterium]
GILYNSRHRKSVDWVCSRNGDNAFTIGHRDVPALSCNPEARFLKSGDSSLVIYPREFWHALSYIHITGFLIFT